MFLAANPSLCISLDKPEIYGKCCALSAIKIQQHQKQQKRNKKQLQQFNDNLESKEKSNVKAENVVQLMMMLKGLSNDMCVRE